MKSFMKRVAWPLELILSALVLLVVMGVAVDMISLPQANAQMADGPARAVASKAYSVASAAPAYQKLRRLARSAQISNPIDRPPLIIPADYANSTAVLTGQAVKRNGNVYVVAVAGTTASSGGPSTTTSGDVITDGTAGFAFFGSLPRAANDADAPTVTFGTSNPGLGTTWTPVSNASLFRVLGASPVAYRTNLWELQTFVAASGGSPVQRTAAVQFVTDATKFAISLPSNSGAARVIIDGQYLSLSSYNPAAADSWLTIDYSGVGGRKLRTVTVQTNKSFSYFGGVQTAATDQVMAPANDDSVRAVVVADSLEAGAGPGPSLAGGAPGTLWGQLVGIDDVWLLSTGSTGDIATASGTAYNYAQRAPQIIALNPAVVVIAASTNDIGHTASDITAARLSLLRTLRAALPRAILVNEGCWPKNDAGVPTVEGAVLAAVTAMNDPLTFFIPRYTEVPAWVTSSNRGLMIAADGTHPTDLGSHQNGRLLAKGWRKYVLPFLPDQVSLNERSAPVADNDNAPAPSPVEIAA
jgi:lysophospholipase L1-like esterase